MRSPLARRRITRLTKEELVSSSFRTFRLSFTRTATDPHVVTKTSLLRVIAASRSFDKLRIRRPVNSSLMKFSVCAVTPLNGANQNQTTSSTLLNFSTRVPAMRVFPAPVGASMRR